MFSCLYWLLSRIRRHTLIHCAPVRGKTTKSDCIFPTAYCSLRFFTPLQLVFVSFITFHQKAMRALGTALLEQFTCCHTETEVADKTCCLARRRILPPVQAVPALTQQRLVAGRVVIRVPFLRQLHVSIVSVRDRPLCLSMSKWMTYH